MKNFAVLLLLFLSFQLFDLQAQTTPQWDYLSGSHQVKGVAHDGNILWFATEHYGVGRYNRSRNHVQYFDKDNSPLSSNKINQIHSTPKGKLWIQNEDKWLVFDGQSWKVFDESNSPITSEQMGYDWAIAPNGTIYLAYAYGIFAFDGLEWRTMEMPEDMRNSFLPQIEVDAEGHLWASGTTQLFRLEGENWQSHPFPAGTILENSWISDLKIDSQQNVWFSLSGYYPTEMVTGGLVRYDGTNWKIYESQISGVELNGRHLTIDKEDDVWVVSGFNGALVHFDVDKETFATYHTPFGLDAIFLSSVSFDGVGQLWMGTNWGLQRLTEQKLEEVPIAFPEKWILQRVANRQQFGVSKIWFKSRDGLVNFDGQNWEFVPFEGELEVFREGFGTVVPTTDGSFWSISQGKIFQCLDGECIQHMPVDFTEQHGKVNVGMEDRVGNIWFLVNKRQQLVYYNGTEWINMQESMEKLNINYGASIYAMTADHDNNIWIGTSKGKLHKWNGESWQTFDLRDHNIYNYQPIHDLAVDGNNQIWIAQQERLKLFDGNEVIATHSSESLGIEFTRFWDVQVNPSNNELWVGTSNAGLLHYNGTTWEHFHHENSPLNKVGINYLLIDPMGHKWIVPQYNGFHIYRAEGVNELNTPLEPGEEEDDHPDYTIGENIPNPFVSVTRIPIEISVEGWAKIKVVDSAGRIVAQAQKDKLSIGTHYHLFDAQTLESGFYYYFVETESGSSTGRMLKM